MKSKRDYNSVISLLKETINSFDWITDFDKCLSNTFKYNDLYETVEKLINSDNFDSDFTREFTHNSDVAKIFGIMLSLRDDKPRSFLVSDDDSTIITYDFKKCNNTVDEYLFLIKETKLIEHLKRIDKFDLKSFILGVECGLDSNARKNRSGKAMENLIKEYFEKYKLNFKEQVQVSNYLEKDIDLKNIFQTIMKDKKFDFVVNHNDITYFIETNFFSGNGSKIDSEAHRLIEISQNINKSKKYRFIYITDGIGWLKTKSELQQIIQDIEYVYFIEDLKTNIFE